MAQRNSPWCQHVNGGICVQCCGCPQSYGEHMPFIPDSEGGMNIIGHRSTCPLYERDEDQDRDIEALRILSGHYEEEGGGS